MKVTLLSNIFRKVVYFPYRKTLLTIWKGQIPNQEYDNHLDYLEELIEHYEIEHFVVDTKKAKSHFFKPSLKFIENVLNKAVQKGTDKLTMVQKHFGNRQFVERAYQKAMSSGNLDVEVAIVETNSMRNGIQRISGAKNVQYSSERIRSDFSPFFK